MRRSFLIVLIVSVVASALLGIVALLAGRLGETEVRILLSTLCVAGASILSMACAAAAERAGGALRRRVAAAGILTAVLGFAGLLLGIWVEIQGDPWWQASASVLVVAAWCTHAALLLLAELPASRRWLAPLTLCATGALAVLLIVQVWLEDDVEWRWRAVGIVGILGTAGTILTAVFQRLARSAAPGGAARDGRRCPHCGGRLPEELLR